MSVKYLQKHYNEIYIPMIHMQVLTKITIQNIHDNPLTAGAVHIRFLHFLLAHYISSFKPVKVALISKI